MGWPPEKPPRDDDLGDVAALADGSLPADREDEVRARVAASPVLSEAYMKQRRALVAIRAADVSAPFRLRQHLAAYQDMRFVRVLWNGRHARARLALPLAITALALLLILSLVAGWPW